LVAGGARNRRVTINLILHGAGISKVISNWNFWPRLKSASEDDRFYQIAAKLVQPALSRNLD